AKRGAGRDPQDFPHGRATGRQVLSLDSVAACDGSRQDSGSGRQRGAHYHRAEDSRSATEEDKDQSAIVVPLAAQEWFEPEAQQSLLALRAGKRMAKGKAMSAYYDEFSRPKPTPAPRRQTRASYWPILVFVLLAGLLVWWIRPLRFLT